MVSHRSHKRVSTRRTFLQSVLGTTLSPELLASAQTRPPVSSPPWLHEVAQQLQREFHLPAVWVAVHSEGKVEAAVIGVKKWGDPTRATLQDKLTIASISKPMAGLWIATLVDQGKLSYQTKLLDVLPELAPHCLPEHADITLGQLVTHTAGVLRDVRHLPNNLRLDQYREERLRQAREVVSTPAPAGSKGKEQYSNNGVTLAVTMAERVAKEPYEVAAGRLYRERLKLTSWGVWAMDQGDALAVPWPHEMQEQTPIPCPPQSIQFQFVRPSGGAHCTITDLVRFGLIATHSSRTAANLLKPETWQQVLERGETDKTTLGCFYAGGRDFPIYDHSGSLGTTNSHLRVLPAWQTAFAFHTNASGDAFRNRGIQVVQDAIRKRRAERFPPPACSLVLTSVTTVDASWQNVVLPKKGDDKVRIRVDFRIETAGRTGDLQTRVKLGDVERHDDRYLGLAAGNHRLHFEFDLPKTHPIQVQVTLDALGTAGNRTPHLAHTEVPLPLAP